MTHVFGSLIPILAIVISVFFAIRNRKSKRIAYWWQSNRFETPEIPGGVVLSFDGESIDGVTLHEIFVWNSGNTLLADDDFVMFPGIHFPGPSRLKLLESRTSQEGLGVELRKRRLILDFDFINPGQGVWITVLEGSLLNALDPRAMEWMDSEIRGATNAAQFIEARPMIDLYHTFKFSVSFALGSIIFLSILAFFEIRSFTFQFVGVFSLVTLAFFITMVFPVWRVCLHRAPNLYLGYWDRFRTVPR